MRQISAFYFGFYDHKISSNRAWTQNLNNVEYVEYLALNFKSIRCTNKFVPLKLVTFEIGPEISDIDNLGIDISTM